MSIPVITDGELGSDVRTLSLNPVIVAVNALGTAANLDVGTGASQVVQLTGGSKLPAVDGSLLTNLPFGHGSTTAVAGAATLNTGSGIVTSEALIAATTYTLTLTNSLVASTSTVLVNVTNSAGLPVTLTSTTEDSGSVVIVLGMAALTGTVKIRFAVFN